jgi:hypothetical protein
VFIKMIWLKTIVLILTGFILGIVSDQTFYSDTYAANDPGAFVNLNKITYAHNNIVLSSNQYSGTNGSMFITYVGDFSSSGPHILGNLTTPGTEYISTIQLDRIIGTLSSVWVENAEYDSLLISTWKIRIQEVVYELEIPQIWLETFDPTLAAQAGDGFSPDANIMLPSSSTLLLNVKSSYFQYSSVGIYTGN